MFLFLCFAVAFSSVTLADMSIGLDVCFEFNALCFLHSELGKKLEKGKVLRILRESQEPVNERFDVCELLDVTITHLCVV